MRLTDYTHVFIDFDETLFDHKSYIDWLAQYLRNSYGIDTTDYLASFDEYHEVRDAHGRLRLYKHEEHLFEKAGLSWNMLSGEIETVLKTGSNDFCYPEVHDFVASISNISNIDIRLLTYGDGAYQRFKINLCRHIHELPIHVVGQAKGNFLGKHYGDSRIRGVLIDDKAPLIMPANWQHVWINRSGLTKPSRSDCIEILSLSEIA